MNKYFNFIEKLCLFIIRIFKLKIREIERRNNELYLIRYYIYRKTFKWLPSIYLHCFHSSDEDLELHNHEWNISFSIILAGSYSEERLIKDKNIIRRIFKPGYFNIIRANDFHRVDLLTPRVWTLFISGPKFKDTWGFLDRNTFKFVPWQEHIQKKKI